MEIDNNTMTTSLYIPIIDTNISETYIAKCFHDNKIGCVNRVDFVINKQKNRREAFVYFSKWYTSNASNLLKSQLKSLPQSKEQCRFIYNGTKYWPLLLNKNPIDKNSPARRSNSIYEIEERILNIENSIQRLTFMTKLHDANIRFILRKNPEHTDYIHTNNVQETQMKRFKI